MITLNVLRGRLPNLKRGVVVRWLVTQEIRLADGMPWAYLPEPNNAERYGPCYLGLSQYELNLKTVSSDFRPSQRRRYQRDILGGLDGVLHDHQHMDGSRNADSNAHIATCGRRSADKSCEESDKCPSTIAIVDIGATLLATLQHLVASWDPSFNRDVCRRCACGHGARRLTCVQRGVVAICRRSSGTAYGRKSGMFTWPTVTPACRRVPWRTVGYAAK